MAKNEVYIAAGVVGLGIAYYLLFGDEAQAGVPNAPPPRLPSPQPQPQPGGGSTVFTSARCPGLDADLPEEYKRDVDAFLSEKHTPEEWNYLINLYQEYPGAKACLTAAFLKATTEAGLFTPAAPGQKAVDQTKTCAYWVGVYNQYKAQVDVIKAGLADANWVANHPNAIADLQQAAAGLNMARNAAAQLGGCGLPLT